MIGLIQIQGGTRSDSDPFLCRSCRFGRVAEDSGGRIFADCLVNGVAATPIKIRVIECTKYQNRSLPSLTDLYEMAWVLETSKNQRGVGFLPWKEYKLKNPGEGIPY